VTVIRAGIDGYDVGTVSCVWVQVSKCVDGIRLQALM
jgi:hypothetical protein